MWLVLPPSWTWEEAQSVLKQWQLVYGSMKEIQEAEGKGHGAQISLNRGTFQGVFPRLHSEEQEGFS